MDAALTEERTAPTVVFCGVCGYPPEYCEYGPDVRKCLPWLREHASARVDSAEKVTELLEINDAMHKRKPPAGAPEAGEGAQAAAEAGAADKPAAAAPAAEEKRVKKPRAPKVVVSRQQRSKRKFLTVISGLDVYKVDAKEACSAFKKKFACGVSQGKDSGDIEIQGDVTFEVADFIAETWPQIDKKNIKLESS